MKQYEVTFDAEICVTVDANSKEEAEKQAGNLFTRRDVSITGVFAIDLIGDESDYEDDE